jgi:hypothetical protein
MAESRSNLPQPKPFGIWCGLPEHLPSCNCVSPLNWREGGEPDSPVSRQVTAPVPAIPSGGTLTLTVKHGSASALLADASGAKVTVTIDLTVPTDFTALGVNRPKAHGLDSVQVAIILGKTDTVFRLDAGVDAMYANTYPDGSQVTPEDWVAMVQALQRAINTIQADRGITDLVAAAG